MKRNKRLTRKQKKALKASQMQPVPTQHTRKIKPMFSLGFYLKTKAEKRLAKLQFRQDKKTKKLDDTEGHEHHDHDHEDKDSEGQ